MSVPSRPFLMCIYFVCDFGQYLLHCDNVYVTHLRHRQPRNLCFMLNGNPHEKCNTGIFIKRKHG